MIKKMLNFVRIIISAIQFRHRNKNEMADPYIVTYENPTLKKIEGVLFGFGPNFGKSNYGNDSRIIIYENHSSYNHLLAQSAFKPFRIKALKIRTAQYDNLPTHINFVTSDANGQAYSKPLSRALLKREPLHSIVEFHNDNMKINGNAYISFYMKPESQLEFIIYPFRTRLSIIDIIKRSYQQTFPLTYFSNMKLAILLYGSTSQKELIGKIHVTLQHQLDQINSNDIEVITYHDSGEKSDEEKKQWLLEQTVSKNYVFIKPTTLLPDNFIVLRFNALKHHKPTKQLVELGIFRKEMIQK